MGLVEYTLLAASSLFVIVDPLAVIPSFIAMTPENTPAERTHTAKVACYVVAGVLLVFGFAGQWIFRFLCITMPAFQIAASIMLLIVALDMLRAQPSRVRETSEDTSAGTEKTDIAVTPLAIPMLSGPGAISTVILMQAQAATVWHSLMLAVCIVSVATASYWILRMAAHGVQWLNPIALRIGTRIMGLLLAAIAVQFMLNALKVVKTDMFG
jgi:multiple antibiotic resistance protein